MATIFDDWRARNNSNNKICTENALHSGDAIISFDAQPVRGAQMNEREKNNQGVCGDSHNEMMWWW